MATPLLLRLCVSQELHEFTYFSGQSLATVEACEGLILMTTHEDIFKAIRSELINKSYNTQLPNGTATSVKVGATYQDGENDFPQIVIGDPEILQGNFGFGQLQSSREVRVLIELYSRYKRDITVMADKVTEYLTTPGTFQDLHVESVQGSNDIWIGNSNKIHSKTLAFQFRMRG